MDNDARINRPGFHFVCEVPEGTTLIGIKDAVLMWHRSRPACIVKTLDDGTVTFEDIMASSRP